MFADNILVVWCRVVVGSRYSSLACRKTTMIKMRDGDDDKCLVEK